MAIILEGSDQSPVMWGRIGNYQIHRTKQGKMYLRSRQVAFNPNTPAQLNIREVYREGNLRWKNFERSNHLGYWINFSLNMDFASGYHVFMSSFMLIYKEKMSELGSHTAAISFLQNTANTISYRESLYRKQKVEHDKLLNRAVLDFQKTAAYKAMLKDSMAHLKANGWLKKTKFGIIPYIDAIVEPELKKIGIIPVSGGYGSSAFGTGTYGV